MSPSAHVHGPALLGLGCTLVLVGLAPALTDAAPAAVEAAAPASASESESEPTVAPSGGTTAEPAPSPVPPPPTAPPTTSEPSSPATTEPSVEVVVTETDVIDFYAALAAALRAGDVTTLHQLLHPAVIERYGAEQCSTSLAEVGDDSLTIEVLGTSSPGPWTWDLDGVTTEVDPAIAVDIRLSAGGTSFEQEAHLALADGALRWFTDCGEPEP